MTALGLRVVNYHLTRAANADTLEREFAALANRYSPVREDDLALYLTTGHWPLPRDGVIPVFYNGYRNNFDVARPLLDRHGLIGWFMVVTGFVDCPPEHQTTYAAAHGLRIDPADPRPALSWDEVRALDASHVVASHTRSHARHALTDAALLRAEVIGAQSDFQRELGHPVRSLAWAFGGAQGEHPLADAAVIEAGHEFLFSNFRVQRVRQ